MPHSSSGYGEVKLNRIYLVENEKATEGGDGKLSLEGQESSPPTTVAMVTWIHGQVVGLEAGKVVPVTFRDKAERNGYYTITSSASDLTDHQSEICLADWKIELKREGSESEVDIQSRLTGTVRQNDFSLTGTKWHAPAISHYAYYTGTTTPSNHDRVGADGTIRVYTSIPANTSPRWGCPVASYLTGAVKLTSTTYVSTENDVEGVNRQIGVSGWTLSNGLIRISPSATAGRLTIGVYTGASYQDRDWNIQAGGSNLLAWTSATVLRNDAEQIVIRLTSSRSASVGGRDTLDLTLRRGSWFVEGYLQTSTSATLGLVPNVTYAATDGTSYLVQTSTGADGTRAIAGSARTITRTTGTGAISKSSATTFDFWISATIAAGGTGGTATDLRDQYIGSLPEITYAVKR